MGLLDNRAVATSWLRLDVVQSTVVFAMFPNSSYPAHTRGTLQATVTMLELLHSIFLDVKHSRELSLFLDLGSVKCNKK